MRVRLKPLSQQVIVVTIASSGINFATAKAATKAGTKIMLAARNADALLQIEQDIRSAGGEARYVPTDVTNLEAIEVLADIWRRRYEPAHPTQSV